MNFIGTEWRRILLAANVTDARRKKRKGRRGGSGFDEQRSALFVAEGILLCRLSPETFITAHRLLGIANVFDENDVDVPAVAFSKDPALRWIGNSYGQKELSESSSPGCERLVGCPDIFLPVWLGSSLAVVLHCHQKVRRAKSYFLLGISLCILYWRLNGTLFPHLCTYSRWSNNGRQKILHTQRARRDDLW